MNLPMSSSLEDVDGPRVVMLGPPGSGKGTHARLLAERFNIPHLSTGALLRREMAAGSSLGVRVAAAVHAGQLVDDAAIIVLVRTAITSPAARMAGSSMARPDRSSRRSRSRRCSKPLAAT